MNPDTPQLNPFTLPPPETPAPRTRTHALRNWLRAHKKAVLFSSLGVVVAIGGSAVALWQFGFFSPASTQETNVAQSVTEPEPEPVIYYSPLTGNIVASEMQTTQAVTGIMIENSPDARPQSGIKDSGVVFEAIAEGGITRFLVIYQEQKPELIGPVRSVRMYYVDWIAAFNASVAHIGGSAAALEEVRNGTYRDIDQFFNPAAYWRATDRYAPHNVYTSFSRLDALNAQKGYTSSSFDGFPRDDSEAVSEELRTATSIDVTMSSYLYNSHYDYNAVTNTYDRSQGGAPHLDREAGQISPRVVVVMKVAEELVLEDGWREQINTIGQGTAYIFQNGSVTEATWKKTSKTSQIQFLSADGEPISLARGQTWISAVPESSGGVDWR